VLEDSAENVLVVTRLKLAAWLRFKQQRLLRRVVTGDGNFVYVFERTPETDDLIQRWDDKTPFEIALSQFSAIVSFEIRTAIRLRRQVGITSRLNQEHKS